MKLRVVGGFGGELPTCRATSFQIGDSLALDAGSLSMGLPLELQVGLRHILLSHSHADHCASLSYFTENVFGHIPGPVAVYGSGHVVRALRDHLFNNTIWPDMASPQLNILKLIEIEAYRPIQVGEHLVTPVPVPHTVPCFGFHIDDGQHALLYAADMAPNDEVWEFANKVERLDAVLVECSFPSRMQKLADVSMHLTPRTLQSELAKLHRPADIFIYHIKPPYWDEVVGELAQLPDRARHQVVEQDRTYDIG